MPLKLIAPITFAIIGLTTALFVSNIVLPSPTLPTLSEIARISEIKLPEIKLPDLSYLLPKAPEGKQSGFATLLVTPTPVPTETPIPASTVITPRPTATRVPPLPPITIPMPTGSPFPFDLFKLFNFNLPAVTPGLPQISLPSIPDAIEISDTDINKLISTMTPSDAPVKDVKVTFQEGKILITGKLTKPIEGAFTAEAGVSLVDGVPVVKLTKASLGSLPIPTFLLRSLETGTNEAIKNALASQNVFKVKKLEIKDGKIRFSAELK